MMLEESGEMYRCELSYINSFYYLLLLLYQWIYNIFRWMSEQTTYITNWFRLCIILIIHIGVSLTQLTITPTLNQLESLNCLLIVRDLHYVSIRGFTPTHLPLLHRLNNTHLFFFTPHFSLLPSTLQLFFHYYHIFIYIFIYDINHSLITPRNGLGKGYKWVKVLMVEEKKK